MPSVRIAMRSTAFLPPAIRSGIRSIPTLVLFSGGRELARQAGAMTAADIVRWLTSRI